jgi:eukaryotic-like serine/threonine-protein kinase
MATRAGPFRPTRLGQWEVIAKIAGGGMSAVYLGRRAEPAPDIPNVVALKIVRHDVRLDERMLQMFLEEGKLIARLTHPNIVRTLEVGGDAEQDFIAMELMLGKTFAAIHDAITLREVRLNPEIAAWACARVADALHYAHELSDEMGRPLALVHRDVNPANVFASFAGEVKLFDFGLAKVTAGDVSGSHLLAGKLSYLSPEQIMQMPIDRRSDIFSLGTTLWELLTGRRLFRRDSDLDTIRAVQLGPIPDPRTVAPEVPEALARIARTALERNREHRYPSAEYFARDLDAFVFQRSSPNDVTARLAQLVDTLFPGEQKRQAGWLKPAISSSGSRQMGAVTPPGSMPPTSLSRSRSHSPGEVTQTQVMPNAPPSRPRDVAGTLPDSGPGRFLARVQDTMTEVNETFYNGPPGPLTPRDGIPPTPSSSPASSRSSPSSSLPPSEPEPRHLPTARHGSPTLGSLTDDPVGPSTEREVATTPSAPAYSPPSRPGPLSTPRSSPLPSPLSTRSRDGAISGRLPLPLPPPRPVPSAPPPPQRRRPASVPPPGPLGRKRTSEPWFESEDEESKTDVQALAPPSRTDEHAAFPAAIGPPTEPTDIPVIPPASGSSPSLRGGLARPKRAPIPLPSRLKPGASSAPSAANPSPGRPAGAGPAGGPAKTITNTKPPDSDTKVDRITPADANANKKKRS